MTAQADGSRLAQTGAAGEAADRVRRVYEDLIGHVPRGMETRHDVT